MMRQGEPWLPWAKGGIRDQRGWTQGPFYDEQDVSYLDCHGDTIGVYICQKFLIHILNWYVLLYVNFNLTKFLKIAKRKIKLKLWYKSIFF